MRLCSVEGCKRKHKAKGLCQMHYTIQNRIDTPRIPKPIVPSDIPYLLEYIEKRIVKTSTQCHEWTETRDRDNYGKVSYKNRNYRVHRLVWEIHKENPGELFVCHTCDNPPCCNINHLFLDDHPGNMRDMIDKGRNALQKGEYNPQSKLKEENIFEIFDLARAEVSQKEIAKLFGIAPRTVSDILRGKRWGYLFKI